MVPAGNRGLMFALAGIALLLIASLVGEEWKRIYAYALEHGFRFLSYGDGCLLWGDKS